MIDHLALNCHPETSSSIAPEGPLVFEVGYHPRKKKIT